MPGLPFSAIAIGERRRSGLGGFGRRSPSICRADWPALNYTNTMCQVPSGAVEQLWPDAPAIPTAEGSPSLRRMGPSAKVIRAGRAGDSAVAVGPKLVGNEFNRPTLLRACQTTYYSAVGNYYWRVSYSPVRPANTRGEMVVPVAIAVPMRARSAGKRLAFGGIEQRESVPYRGHSGRYYRVGARPGRPSCGGVVPV
jgi:hypothetical protein